MDGAHVGLRGMSPKVKGELGWELCGKTFSTGRVGVAIKAAGKETRVADGLGVVCIRRLIVLLREYNIIVRGTGLRVSFNVAVLAGLSWSFT